MYTVNTPQKLVANNKNVFKLYCWNEKYEFSYRNMMILYVSKISIILGSMYLSFFLESPYELCNLC